MSQRLFCDGCGTPIDRQPTISGGRANGRQGGSPLPDGAFDWCEPCAFVAFRAVRDTRGDTR